jgi:hypothetical protein
MIHDPFLITERARRPSPELDAKLLAAYTDWCGEKNISEPRARSIVSDLREMAEQGTIDGIVQGLIQGDWTESQHDAASFARMILNTIVLGCVGETAVNCTEIPAESAELIVVKCDQCSFDLGLDASYLANHTITMPCPACQHPLTIEEIE